MTAPFFSLESTSTGSRARAGRLRTAHGEIETPVFMPVGTAGAVKALSPQRVQETGAKIILGNTYHLYLRPGTDLISRAGGLHRFAAWPGAMLTDSGGFQVWSLETLRKITENGVEFRSHIDGSKHLFTAESVMEAQRKIGADIIMAFDECTPWPATPAETEKSLRLTQRWTERAIEWLAKNPALHGYEQSFFGIVQGGMHKESRQAAIEHLKPLDLPGYALGGLSVGEPAPVMYEVAEYCDGLLPREKPRYVMGVGTPSNLLELIERGMDMFDCVLPTRNARNGTVYTWEGALHYKAARHAQDIDKPLDERCNCYTCKNFSRAYLRHLFVAGEFLAFELASLHTLTFYQDLMKEARKRILEGGFEGWKADLLATWSRPEGA
ncbi:MAG TPA: tRNA guanosine(34) transglycosylase Tgt [Fibrobacteria bacterium]|jgi:queuine tRNA-ribosyltransferase|nr:tRNA guanosine(34) transglycosylase Tgt [Fibrobacteria bacterium]